MIGFLQRLARGGDRGEWIEAALEGPYGRILDIGCSRGWTLALLRPKAVSLVGIDMDKQALAEARLAYPTIEFIEQTAITLPFPSESFDVVILSEVIEHVGNANKRTVIDEAHRVLKSGGVFVFTAPYAGALAWLDPMDFKRRFPAVYRAYMRLTHYLRRLRSRSGMSTSPMRRCARFSHGRFEIRAIEYCGLFMPFFTWILAIDNRLQWLPRRWHQCAESPPRMGERRAVSPGPGFQLAAGGAQAAASCSIPGMKLAFTHVDLPNESRGGVAYQVHYLANEMVKRGHSVTMFTFSPAYSECLYSVHQFALPAWAKRFHAFFLAWRLGRTDFSAFDILHTFGDNYLIGGKQPPHVRTFSGSAWDEAASARTWKRRVYQWVTA